MGICNEISDNPPYKNFLQDLDALHTWKPTQMKIEILKCYERLETHGFCDALSEF